MYDGNRGEALDIAEDLDHQLRFHTGERGTWMVKANILIKMVLADTEESMQEAWHLADSYRRRRVEDEALGAASSSSSSGICR